MTTRANEPCVAVTLDSDFICGYESIKNIIKPCLGGRSFDVYSQNKVLEGLELENFCSVQVWASTCGTDYSSNIPGLGPKYNLDAIVWAERKLLESSVTVNPDSLLCNYFNYKRVVSALKSIGSEANEWKANFEKALTVFVNLDEGPTVPYEVVQ